jgi:hypothetical protein
LVIEVVNSNHVRTKIS